MKFYDRKKEIGELREIRERSRETAQWTVVTGRRRVGKTALVQTALGDEPYVYFYVARKAEADLCETFAAEVEAKLGIPVGAGGALRFAPIFEAVLGDAPGHALHRRIPGLPARESRSFQRDARRLGPP